MNNFRAILLCIAVLLVSSCTWVELTDNGENITLLSAEEVTNCNRTGSITVEVIDRALFERNADKVAKELRTLARNGAVNRGDTVVPSTRVVDGEQTFIIYRCRT